MKVTKEVTRCKNAVARAYGVVARIQIELRLAERARDAALKALDKAIEADTTQGNALHIFSAGVNKISVIKAIREITFLGLKEAKDIADAAGAPSEKNLVRTFTGQTDLKDAERILQAAGAIVRIV